MVVKRLKTEYMRRFKGPQRDSSSCYTDLLRYRLMRRLLEQTHSPWVWTGWDRDSGSGSSGSGSGTSTPRGPEQDRGGSCLPAGRPPSPRGPADSPRRQIEPPEAEPPRSAEQDPTEKEIILEVNQKDKNDRQTKDELSVQPILNYRRVKSASLEKSQRTPQLTITAQDAAKETKPPFAMYGWAEREAEVGCKKTYNVGASALRGQIYESAVRAQNRRLVAKTLRAAESSHKHQCKSSQGHKPSSQHLPVGVLKPAEAEDPWLSEYMRCYSTRSL
ncbi:centriole, cilia and spindle-associated protein-like [Heptranchias perlo]|uniref:centriole, cilia and spindle-associated protein-like n=1 Tax=Heptranchias perlo TaxID=212740 RepID=UPI003559F194